MAQTRLTDYPLVAVKARLSAFRCDSVTTVSGADSSVKQKKKNKHQSASSPCSLRNDGTRSENCMSSSLELARDLESAQQDLTHCADLQNYCGSPAITLKSCVFPPTVRSPTTSWSAETCFSANAKKRKDLPGAERNLTSKRLESIRSATAKGKREQTRDGSEHGASAQRQHVLETPTNTLLSADAPPARVNNARTMHPVQYRIGELISLLRRPLPSVLDFEKSPDQMKSEIYVFHGIVAGLDNVRKTIRFSDIYCALKPPYLDARFSSVPVLGIGMLLKVVGLRKAPGDLKVVSVTEVEWGEIHLIAALLYQESQERQAMVTEHIAKLFEYHESSDDDIRE